MAEDAQRTVVKGRGAASNRVPTRFGLAVREVDGDWRDEAMRDDPQPLRPATSVTIERPRTILSRNTSPDIPFDQSINPYRGCEHGCVYCYARPSHALHDLSPGLDFETQLFAKPDAAHLLRAELARKTHVPTPIAFGTNTDPYQPIEGRYAITRSCLAVLAEYDHPLSITTKSDRVLRDIDLLAGMAAKGLVAVAISVTSLDPATHRTLEPRAASARKRLSAIKALAEAGIPAHLSVSPIIPAITDHELEALLEAGAEAGARTASYIPLRLPNEVAPLFREWLDAHHPDRAGKVMALVQSLRGGRDNDPRFGSRMRGEGVWADLIRTRFRIACARLGLNQERISLNQTLFRPPPLSSNSNQLGFGF